MRFSKSNFLCAIIVLISCSDGNFPHEETNVETSVSPTNRVILSSDLKWEKLNPARGDQSPQAATIWGDRKGEVSTGFLAKFVDGFSSPSHIHNVTYRAVVIDGLVHNDDPNAEEMWMPKGSFWTQPEGEAHITSAKGDNCIALVEIDRGPYLVKPTSEAFDNGERPINIDPSNLIWMNSENSTWIDSECKAEISFLDSDIEQSGLLSLFVKLPRDFNGEIHSTGNIFHAVVIKGELVYKMPDQKEKAVLKPGSYFGSDNSTDHLINSRADSESIVYIRTNGSIRISSNH